MTNSELRGYVRAALEGGRSVEDCRKDLLAAGWQAEDIDGVIREVGAGAQTQPGTFQRIKNYLVWLKIFKPTVRKVLLTAPVFLVFPWIIDVGGGVCPTSGGGCYGGLTFWFGGFNLLVGFASDIKDWISDPTRITAFEWTIESIINVAVFSYIFVCVVVRNESTILSKKVFKNLLRVVAVLAITYGIIFVTTRFLNACVFPPGLNESPRQPFPQCLLQASGLIPPSPPPSPFD